MLAVLFALAVGEASGWRFLRAPAQHAMSRALGAPVLLEGEFRARLLWRPKLVVSHLSVGAAHAWRTPLLLQANGVELAWRWRDLWHWQRGAALRVRRLHADTLDAHLVRRIDGRASWQIGAAHAHAGAGAQAGVYPSPRIDSLRIGAGRIDLHDELHETHLRVEVHARAGTAASASAAHGYEATVSGAYRGVALRLRAATDGALPLLSGENSVPDTPPLTLRVEGEMGSAQFAFEGTAADLLAARRLDGEIRVRGASLVGLGQVLGVTLPSPSDFDIAGHLSHGLGVWHLRAERALIGQSRLAGDFRYHPQATPPLLSGRLTGLRLALADVGGAVGSAQRRFELPALRAIDADVQVAIDELDFGNPAVAPVNSLQTRLRIEAGVLYLDAWQATPAGSARPL